MDVKEKVIAALDVRNRNICTWRMKKAQDFVIETHETTR